MTEILRLLSYHPILTAALKRYEIHGKVTKILACSKIISTTRVITLKTKNGHVPIVLLHVGALRV